jgi:hypothetical protein
MVGIITIQPTNARSNRIDISGVNQTSRIARHFR